MESFRDFLFNKKGLKSEKSSEEIKTVEEVIQITESIEEDESVVIEEHKIDGTIKNEEIPQLIEESIKEIEEEIVEQKAVEVLDDTYKIYRDKSETFLCDMEITGANPENSKARIIIESKDLTYMFEGTINSKGQCKIPLKKMNFLQENEVGNIKLEVIAEDMVFVPWSDTFTAVSSRKVKVKSITESEDTSTKVGIKITRIK
jgi:hypothetical protein